MPVTRIYKSSDWQVYTYQPEPGSFVLDFSQLNGPDVLGTSGGGVVAVQYEIGNISIVQGGSVDSGVIHQIQPSLMSVEFIVKDFNTDVINDFYVGTTVTADVFNGNFTATERTPMFSGVIESVQVKVIPGEDFSIISLECVSYSRNVLNATLGITKNETTLKGELIETALVANNLTIDLIDYSNYQFKGTARESKSVGEWITDITLCDFSQFTDHPTPVGLITGASYSDLIVFVNPYPRVEIKKNVGVSAGTLDENIIFDLNLDWSGVDSPTVVTLTNYTDSSIVYQYGSTQEGSGGANAYSATVDVKNLNQMIEIGDQLLSMTKSFRPVVVSTITATENQEITFKDSLITNLGGGPAYDIPWFPENIYQVGETVEIDLPDYGIDQQKMIIVGRTMEITPDNWTTTYNLWKGFTN
jgi:hypothetical protein